MSDFNAALWNRFDALTEQFAAFRAHSKPRGHVPLPLRVSAVGLVDAGLRSTVLERKLELKWGQIKRWRAALGRIAPAAAAPRVLNVVPDVVPLPRQVARVTIEGRRITIDLPL